MRDANPYEQNSSANEHERCGAGASGTRLAPTEVERRLCECEAEARECQRHGAIRRLSLEISLI